MAADMQSDHKGLHSEHPKVKKQKADNPNLFSKPEHNLHFSTKKGEK
jgi:hypothetical protein